MPRRRLVMIAVVVLAVLGSGLLLWRGEGLTGPVIVIALAAVVVLQLDARRRLATIGAEQRRAAAALRTLDRGQAQTRTELERVRRSGTEVSTALVEAAAARATIAERADQRRRQDGRVLRSLVRDGQTPTQTQAQLQLQSMFAPVAPLPVVAGWAMEPTALIELVDVVRRRRPRLVVECGSGTSTLWLAYALRRNGSGRVIAIEHEAEYAQATRQALADHDLTEWADVLDAPLAPVDTPRGPMSWYGFDARGLRDIDLLVVDGPPRTTGEMARYPALPVLAAGLAPEARILVDDANRADEQAVLQAWRQTWDLELERDVSGRALLLKVAGAARSADDAPDGVGRAVGDGA